MPLPSFMVTGARRGIRHSLCDDPRRHSRVFEPAIEERVQFAFKGVKHLRCSDMASMSREVLSALLELLASRSKSTQR